MKNEAAVSLGRLGGQKTAKRGKAYFKRISKLAHAAKKAKRLIDTEAK